jgi:uncharacterized protein (TIGR02996 family)
MSELEGLLDAVVADPQAEDRYQVVADWLEEHDDPQRAELLRLHRRLLATCCEPEEHPERAGWQARIVELLGQGVRPCVPQRTIELGKGVTMTFSFIPAGTYLMGSPKGEEERYDTETLHRVAVTKGYFLGTGPVTQAQWQAVTGGNPSSFKGDDLPVESVSWQDAQDFCRSLGERTGSRFRLPSEAEWEHAARAGTTTPFFFGETITPDRANYDGSYFDGGGPVGVFRERTTPPGTFPPNAWGLHDMHGNVFEWCSGRHGERAGGLSFSRAGGQRVMRGGSWFDRPIRCRSAYRYWVELGRRDEQVGSRLVLCKS